MRVAPLALALSALAAGCSWGDRPPGASPVRTVVVTVANPQIFVGASTRASARLFDGAGHEVPGRLPFWASATPGIVSITATGEIMGLQAGTGVVRASSGNASATATVEVRNPVAKSLTVTRDTATLYLPGGTFQAVAIAIDETGRPIPNPAIIWRSSHPLVATVNGGGFIAGVASGNAMITVAIDSLIATVAVMVRPALTPTAPIIASISPDTLRPGTVATVSGSNFAASAAGNQVLVDGVAATVQSASSSQLVITLPVSGFPCDPAHDAYLQVTAAGGIGSRAVSLQTAHRRTLAAGQSVIVTDADDVRCNELIPGSGRWVVSVYNAARDAVAPTATGNAPVLLRGLAGAALGGASVAPMHTALWVARQATASNRTTPDPHLNILDQNISALRKARVTAAVRGVSSAGPDPASQITTVGNITGVRIPNLDGADFCVQHVGVNARTVFSGPHALILEDTVGQFNGKVTLRGQMDNYFARLGAEFESVIWPMLTATFGNPLAMDAQLSNIGKVVMLFSPRVNAMQGGTVTGFVANCDFFPVGARPSSNGGAFFYAAVPTNPAAGYALPDTRDHWMRLVRSTVIHEVKHLASFAERLGRSLPLEDASWEEGAARIAEEMYARAVYGTTMAENTTYAQSIACDLRYELGAAPCADRPLLMLRHFDALYHFLAAPGAFSPLGRVAATDVNFYAGAWSFLRWASDHSSAEQPFFRDFTVAPVTGVANIEARTGRRWEESLGEWTLAAYVDDIGGFTPEQPRLRMRSWHYPDIWLGLCRDLGPCTNPGNPAQIYLRPSPFASVVRSFGNFQLEVPTMVGGGFVLLDLDGPGVASQAIEVRALTGSGDASPTVRVAIVRVR